VSNPATLEPQPVIEAIALTVVTVVVTLALFGGLFPSRHYPLTVLLWPVLIWVAFRFRPREAATAMLVISFIAIVRTLRVSVPSRRSRRTNRCPAPVWTGITAATSLVLAAAVAVQRDIQGTWRELAVTDPLTGLANHASSCRPSRPRSSARAARPSRSP